MNVVPEEGAIEVQTASGRVLFKIDSIHGAWGNRKAVVVVETERRNAILRLPRMGSTATLSAFFVAAAVAALRFLM